MDLERQAAGLESSDKRAPPAATPFGGCPGRSSHDPPPLKLPSQSCTAPALFVMSLGHDRPAGVPLAPRRSPGAAQAPPWRIRRDRDDRPLGNVGQPAAVRERARAGVGDGSRAGERSDATATMFRICMRLEGSRVGRGRRRRRPRPSSVQPGSVFFVPPGATETANHPDRRALPRDPDQLETGRCQRGESSRGERAGPISRG